MHDATILSASEAAQSHNEVIVREFRQIILWPLRVLADDPEAPREGFHTALEAIRDGNRWAPLTDEFGEKGKELQERHYREFISFLPQVQRFLYGEPPHADGRMRPDAEPVRVFRRQDVKQARVRLTRDAEPLVLEVMHADLYFFYDVDAIIFVIETAAQNIPLVTAQTLLHRFGRAYPSGWRLDGTPIHCPHLVEWIGEDGAVLASSNYGDSQRFRTFVGTKRIPCVADHWEFLLRPIRSDAEQPDAPLRFREIEYHRMPVMAYCAVENGAKLTPADHVSFMLATPAPSQAPLLYSEGLLEKFQSAQQIERFYPDGLDSPGAEVRFLTCGDTLTVLCGGSVTIDDNERGVLGQFRHQYFLLFLIAHFHKAALLMLSDRMVSALKAFDSRNAASFNDFRTETFRLQEVFLRFSQRYLFTEVSGQPHMRNLYRNLAHHLSIEELAREVRREIFDMVQYLDSGTLRRQSSAMHRLTVVTVVGLVGTIVTGFLGMNLLAEADNPLPVKVRYFIITMVATSAFTILAIAFSRPIARFMDWLSGDDLRNK